MLLLVLPAAATTLAVLPLDARGLDAESAELATDALRDAITADGRCEVPTGTAIGAALGAGHEGELKRARERYAAGRAAAAKGDQKGAITALNESVSLHTGAGSAWSRRGELADVLWATADAHLRAGDTLRARQTLTEVARLWPGYASSRAHSTGTAARMLVEVEAGVAKEAWTLPPDESIDAAFAALGTDWLALGVIDGTGQVTLRVLGPDGDNETIREHVPLPIDSLATEWTTLANRVGDVPGGPAPALEEEPEEEPVAVDDPPSPLRPRVEVPRPDADRPVTIREVDTRPVTARWWFWTALVGLVAGGTAAGIVASRPAEEIIAREDGTWSLSVEAP
ncbi:hypothetical protein LBMAG42_33570 [Deltaproteobacteria bacterium]|nr:hypothetical protein LBMAG42_33570 [Deltaproteobacteria bacterium]